jgi:hypothetical protein
MKSKIKGGDVVQSNNVILELARGISLDGVGASHL